MRLTITLPDKLHAELKQLARKEGTTMRAIWIQAIERAVSKEPRRAKVTATLIAQSPADAK